MRRCWLALGALGREQARRRGGSRELGCARPAAADRAAVPSRGDPRVSSGAPSPATNPLAPAAAGIAAVFLRFEADPRAWFSAKAQPLSSSGAARRPRVNLAGFLSTTGRCNSLLDSPAASFAAACPATPKLLPFISRASLPVVLGFCYPNVQFAAFLALRLLPAERKGCMRCFLFQASPLAVPKAPFLSSWRHRSLCHPRPKFAASFAY